MASIEALKRELEQIEDGQVFEYLSTWSLERLLDRLATCVWSTLRQHLRGDMGCSILYRAAPNKTRYVLGGSSTRRTAMDPLARYYDVQAEPRGSYTAWSLRHAEPLLFNDFRDRDTGAREAKKKVAHVSKACELPAETTHSYLTIPWIKPSKLVGVLKQAIARPDKIPPAPSVDNAKLPSCLLRVSFADPGRATDALRLLVIDDGAALIKLFQIVERGQAIALQQQRGAIAVADLNANLLRYVSSEYRGLDELAFHLQTLFGECECSIFLAHILSTKQGTKKEARLHLAATTAWSPSEQHDRFRKAFFDKRLTYACPLDLDPGHPEYTAMVNALAKTERAYHLRDKPVLQAVSQGTGKFHGQGEYLSSESFLAVAIPARQGDQLPYGVIRLVRGSNVKPTAENKHVPGNNLKFTPEDEHLAGVIAKNLTFWLEFFPRNDELVVEWSDDKQIKRDTLRALFAIEDDLPRDPVEMERERERRFGEAEIEFEGFLRKVFAKSKSVTIKKQFGGYSGARVLLVENDAGLDLILKCARKGLRESNNLIIQEVDNYRRFVEGKLALNHNVIYPELIREMRSINGFATTFLGSSRRDRMTLKEYVSTGAAAPAVFASIRRIVSKIVDEICQWWYRLPQRKARTGTVDEFLSEGLRGTIGWHATDEGLLDLNGAVYRASEKLGLKEPDKLPLQLWKEFKNWGANAPAVRWEQGVTHGDLHGGNIYFEPDSMQVWVIDFARTGERALITDLATLEINIKLQLLPLLLKHQKLVDDRINFVQCFEQVERVLASQVDYDTPKLPRILSAQSGVNDRALDALREAVSTVLQIRQLLHQSLGQNGSMTDYRIALSALSHWYMGGRGPSDHDASSLQVLMAYTSVRANVDSLTAAPETIKRA